MLKVIRRIENKLQELFERYCRLSSAMEKCTSRADILGGGGYTDNLSTLTAAKIELEADIKELAGIKARCQSELAALLVDLTDVQSKRDVMYLRYGCLRRFNEIASILNLSLRKVFRLHKEGLTAITEKYGFT